MSIMYHSYNQPQTIHIQVNDQTHHHQLKLTAKMNTLLSQSWTLGYIAVNSNIWLNGSVTICPIGNPPNFIPRAKQLTDFTKSIQINQDHCRISHEPISPELSPNRGILSRLGFTFLLMLLIFLSSYPFSLLIYVTVYLCAMISLRDFARICAAALVRLFRLIC
jgi:hypothetical protein